MSKIPSFIEFINEGVLSKYRSEREGMKLTYKEMEGSFDIVIKKLIEEKIPFYFDCVYKNYTRIGYLVNETINNMNFNGFILDYEKNPDEIYSQFEDILRNTIVEKPGKLHIGRTLFSDITHSDPEIISVVVKAFKQYVKERGSSPSQGEYKRQVTGNKLECNVNIDFLCDKTRVNDMIDFIF